MPDRRVLEKIRRLLMLAKDPSNEHEAALAAEKARELLTKHNLSLKDVELGSIASGERHVQMGARVERWLWVLAKAAAELVDSETLVIRFGPGDNVIAFCGIPQNVETAEVTFGYLAASVIGWGKRRRREGFTEIERLQMEGRPRRGRLTGKGLGSYKLGCAMRIKFEIHFLKEKSIKAEGEGLVHIGNAIAKRHLELHHSTASASKLNWKPPRPGAFAYGWWDGGRVNPNAVHKTLGDGSEDGLAKTDGAAGARESAPGAEADRAREG